MVGSTAPQLTFLTCEPEPRFMHQRRGLQSLPGLLVRHPLMREAP